MKEMVSATGSVRVDLLGGTLDLNPINVILPNVVTLNLATSLKAKVQIQKTTFDGIEIESLDYKTSDKFNEKDITEDNLRNGFFGNLTFIVQILNLFELKRGVKLTLESGSPPGAGLGGSSAMGVTCYSAIAQFLGLTFDRVEAIQKVNALEARILDCGPAGYQDYYPALFGGVLGLIAKPGKVEVEQLYSEELKNYLEKNITLVYSGETRLSGINNWEVYKAFFNKDESVRRGMTEIAKLSHQAFLAIKESRFADLSLLIAKEGEERRRLFPGILTPKMSKLREDLQALNPHFGMKICGAGGGGCFLVIHDEVKSSEVQKLIEASGMKKLPFNIERPL